MTHGGSAPLREGRPAYRQIHDMRARVAQSVEQLICNQRVAGSTPVSGSMDEKWWGSRVVKGNRL